MASLVRTLAILASAIVALSFVMFAVDEIGAGSKNQVRLVDSQQVRASDAEFSRPNPKPAIERVREQAHSAVREKVDDANDILLSPITGFFDFKSVWAARLLPGLIALLVYGLGGLALANAFPKANKPVGDWRESTS